MDYLNAHGALGGGNGTWPDQQITQYNPKELADQIYQAAILYGGGAISSSYYQAYQRVMGSNPTIYPLLYGATK